LGPTNQRVRRLQRLIQKRSERWGEGCCVLEGPDLVRSALDSDQNFEGIYVDNSFVNDEECRHIVVDATARGIEVFSLASGVINKITDATTPQPIVGEVRLPIRSYQEMDVAGLIFVLHDLRDPGNLGTIIRSSDAAGCSGVILTGNSVDPFNPKSLRASAGSIFNVPVALVDYDEVLSYFSTRNVQTLATVVRGGEEFHDVDFTAPSVVVIGSEAHGLGEEQVRQCDRAITIAMAGASESLNAGVAASVIAFEALHQRQRH